MERFIIWSLQELPQSTIIVYSDVPPVSVPQRMGLCNSGSSVGGLNIRLGCAISTSSLMETQTPEHRPS